MFMIPMPPTSSEMPAIEASTTVNVPVMVEAVAAMSLCDITLKSACAEVEMLWRCSQQVGHRLLDGGHLLRVGRLHRDLRQVRVAHQQLLLRRSAG